jgi:Glycosyltransferase family 87
VARAIARLSNVVGMSNFGMLVLSKTNLRIAGIGALLLGATHGSSVVSASCVAIGLILSLWSLGTHRPLSVGFEHRLAAVASAALIVGVFGRPIASLPGSMVNARPIILVGAVVMCFVAFLAGDRPLGRRIVSVLAISLTVTALIILVAQEWLSPLGSDVYHAHRLAGDALRSGQNPYTDAVTFSNGNPFAPAESVVEGYPYPPVALSAYGLAGAFTDPRLISAACWLTFLGWLALGAWRKASDEDSRIKLSVLLLMSLAPLGSEVWYMAWTEPLTLFLFLLAALTWRRAPLWSGVLLGLALASKQYLIFLLPLVLLNRDEGWRRRSTAVVVAAGVTLLAGLAPNPSAFIRATIGNLTGIGFRPDTQSLPGLANEYGVSFMLPNWLWIVVSLVAVALLSRFSRTRSGFMMSAGLGLGIAFIVGLAFPNYWFLVAGLIAIGTALGSADQVDLDSDQESLAGHVPRQETRIAGV